MAVFETIRRQVSIVGKVMDRVTGKPLEDVHIRIVNGPSAFTERISVLAAIHGPAFDMFAKGPDRTSTRHDGLYHFMDLPDGTYRLRASSKKFKNRYGSTERDVTVSRTPQGSVNLVSSDILLSPSTVRGRVVRQGTASPVVMAEIRVTGSLECSHTDENGDYMLAAIEASSSLPRSLTVSAMGYQERKLEVLVPSPGAEAVLDVQIAPL